MVERFSIKVVASAGLCGAAIALSPDAAAAPLITGGHACTQQQAGEVPAAVGGPAEAAGGPVLAAGGSVVETCAAPLTDMSGVPLVVPGPVGAPIVPVVPAGVPLLPGPLPLPLGAPVAPVVPAGAPLIALGGPVAAGAPVDGVAAAPILDMSGVKDAPTGPAPTGGPVPGQPVMPGPSGAR
ncbi:hypothetical protein A5747_13965 [Mycobacterium sp. IS-836]|uniref:hypothetical protein n=1 Tax=Mycobacterium sp. IS-836 TaxID=1834160 RepID=UPI00096BFDC8|nr:hypothetical protein [Mycobacterium sp. IS-836]OMC55311.1 hypothetical protein A5747_13965 [Mycobacterium sp. IS-836]